MAAEDWAKHFISIVGNIGVGKTTFPELIGQRFQWQVLYEKVIDNPYLADYYTNMDKWSFHLQIYFFSHRFQEQMEIAHSTVSCVQDRSIYEDPEIFAHVLHQQSHLDDRDYQTYLELFSHLIPFLPKPNLFIYLRASTWTLLSRIRKRGRDFEMGITGEFLHQLNLAYEHWMRKLTSSENVLIIDTDKLNIERDLDQLEDIYKQIEERLQRQ